MYLSKDWQVLNDWNFLVQKLNVISQIRPEDILAQKFTIKSDLD